MVLVNRREKESHDRDRLEKMRQFRTGLIQNLRTKGASRELRFSEYVERCEVPREEADQIADEIYLQFSFKVMADGVITNEERDSLTRLARYLEIETERAIRIEIEAKSEIYRN